MPTRITRGRVGRIGQLAAIVLASWPAAARAGTLSKELRLLDPVARSSGSACGVYALYVCAKAAGCSNFTLAELQEQLAPGPDGVSAAAIKAAAESHGTRVQAVETDLPGLAACQLPAVLHVQGSHYIAFLGEAGPDLLIFDSRMGLVQCSREWFDKTYHWRGTALIVGGMAPTLGWLLRVPVIALCTSLLYLSVSAALGWWNRRSRSPAQIASHG